MRLVNLTANPVTLVGQTIAAGAIKTVAGGGSGGLGDGGATQGRINTARAGAFDPAGNLIVADTGNSRIRLIDPNGIITTIAGVTPGGGVGGFSGDGGDPRNALLNAPRTPTLDSFGNVFIADHNNNRVRYINRGTTPIAILGQTILPNTIATVMGTFGQGFAGDGGLVTAAQMQAPNSIAFDSSGNLFVSENVGNRIRLAAVAAKSVFLHSGSGQQTVSVELTSVRAASELSQALLQTVDAAGDVISSFPAGATAPDPTDPTNVHKAVFGFSGALEAGDKVRFVARSNIDGKYISGDAQYSLTWDGPASISYGTPLSATQLDATANVADAFVYSPDVGTVFAPGSYTLVATFTPADATLPPASIAVPLVVTKPRSRLQSRASPWSAARRSLPLPARSAASSSDKTRMS